MSALRSADDDHRGEEMAADADAYFAAAKARTADDIRSERNRESRRNQAIAPGIVQVRLQGRREDVDAFRRAIAGIFRAWSESGRFYPDDNGVTGRCYLSVDVRDGM